VTDLSGRLLARRAVEALAAFRLATTEGEGMDGFDEDDDTAVGGSDTGAADQAPGTGVVVGLPGRFDPPVPTVSRTLAAAAQQGPRRLPAHRWTGTDGGLSVVLAETPDALLTLTVEGGPDLPDDTVVAVTWATVSTGGGTDAGRLVTPLPRETVEQRRAAYELGSALDLRSFHLTAVDLTAADALTPAAVEASLANRAYGNAIRAWTELLDRHPDPALRAAFDRALGQL
jgi:hypothetical protein